VIVCKCVCGTTPGASTELEMPIILEMSVAELDSSEWPVFQSHRMCVSGGISSGEVPKFLVLPPQKCGNYLTQTLIKCLMQIKTKRDGSLRHQF